MSVEQIPDTDTTEETVELPEEKAEADAPKESI